MRGRGAFNGSETLRAEALAVFARDPGAAWLSAQAPQADLLPYAERFGIPASLFLLTTTLGAGVPADENGRSFQSTVLELLPAGADADRIVPDWFVWTYASSPAKIRDVLSSTPAEAPAAEIVSLIRRSASDAVSASEWRQARKALTAASGLVAEVAECADIIAAMAWDLEQSPGAVTDTLMALEIRSQRAYDRSIAFDTSLHEQFGQVHSDIVKQSYATVGIETGGKEMPSPEEVQALQTEIERAWMESGHLELRNKVMAHSQESVVVRGICRQAARDGLLFILQNHSEAPTPA